MSQPLTPSIINKVGREIAFAWSDGTETYIPAEVLRRACPCAACGGEPDVTGKVIRPTVQYQPSSFDLQSWEVIGGYGFQPTWADGHRTGIYTFPYIRKLGDTIPG